MSYLPYSLTLYHHILAFMVAISISANIKAADVSAEQSIAIEDLLEKVVVANRYYSYEALLTYEANGSLSTLRLSHWINDDGEHNRVSQRLEFLDGANRNIIREQKLKRCDNGKTRWGLWPSNFDIKDLQRHYEISVQGIERIAEREAITIDFTPKDKFRYGYRFSVDSNTGLLLRSLIVQNNEIIERTQFVSLSLDSDLPKSPSNANVTSWRVPEVDPCHTEQFQSAWSVGWLPEGFTSAGNRVTTLGEQVLMFTDGMVSISVFITSGSYQNVPKITAHRGATVAVISPLPFDPENSVAVVGDVPVVTARRIAVSVKPQ